MHIMYYVPFNCNILQYVLIYGYTLHNYHRPIELKYNAYTMKMNVL